MKQTEKPLLTDEVHKMTQPKNQELVGRKIISVNHNGDAIRLDNGRVLYLDIDEIKEE